ncbi:MAG: type II secretion system protein GspD [Bacillota bacterium]
MRDNKKITALILILVFVLSATAAVGAQGRINDMNFKNADLTDVLRAIAEVADVNLITDSNVSGTITIHLKDISFNKALDLITQTRSLTYKWDENTVVVASPDRIDEIYDNIVTEFVEVKSNDLDNISVIVKDIFPDTQITDDPVRRQFILKGEEERVIEIKEMIERLDSSAVDQEKSSGDLLASGDEQSSEREEVYTESYKLINAELEDLSSKLQSINADLSMKSNSLTNTVTISGRESEVKEAISMAETYDESLEPDTRVVRVDYVDSEKINEIVKGFYPDIKLHVNQARKEIIINGAKNKLDNVVKLVKEINIPQHQVMIEIRVEEISSGLSREIGIDNLENFSTIEFEKDADGDIDGISYSWPELFRLLDESNDSITLANPRLMTLNGEEATMSILDEEPYQVKEINDDGTSSITYEYAEAGVEMTFTPWITENNEVELSISPEVSNFTRINTDSQVPPATSTRSIETKLRLNDGEMFAVGGLIQTEDNGSVTKIPLLGDLPIIGELFKSRLDETNRTELIIFVRPKIIKYGEEVDDSEHLITEGLNDKQTAAQDSEETAETNKEAETEVDSEMNNQEEENESNDQQKEEILEKQKNDSEKEFQELTPEELEAILNKN